MDCGSNLLGFDQGSFPTLPGGATKDPLHPKQGFCRRASTPLPLLCHDSGQGYLPKNGSQESSDFPAPRSWCPSSTINLSDHGEIVIVAGGMQLPIEFRDFFPHLLGESHSVEHQWMVVFVTDGA